MKKLALTITSTCMFIASFSAFGSTSDSSSQSLVNFLVGDRDNVGFTYQGTAGKLKGLSLPMSYYSTPNYWGKFVCAQDGNNCSVTDSYNSDDYTLTPDQSSPGADLQLERVNVHNGTDIYDAACWQIALAVAAVNGETSGTSQNLFQLANNQNIALAAGYDGNANDGSLDSSANRAYTQDNGMYNYHGIKISKEDAEHAFFYRMVTTNWLSNDPFMYTPFLEEFVTTSGELPDDYKKGNVSWLDWKPITGENSWAFFLGPIQSKYLQDVVTNKQSYIPFNSTAIQNASNVLTAFRAMQAPIGGIFYAAPGSLGNVGDKPVDPYGISVENNASALAGMQMFGEVLSQELKHESNLSSKDKATITQKINDVYTIIYGGNAPAGSNFTYTNGMLNFFKNYAWKDGEFIQGGTGTIKSNWVPTLEPKAVDVNTWGLAVLGQPLIDQWYGKDAALNAWKQVKGWGGFTGPDGTLWGVGYTDDTTDPSFCASGNYASDNSVISAEWTAGAINMADVLAAQYDATGNADAANALKADAKTMRKGLLTLRSDNYSNDTKSESAYQHARPANYDDLISIPKGKLSYIYASRRCFIQFGWMANPLPSTTSTSWAVMMNHHFNPFTLGGGNTPNKFYWGNLNADTTVTVKNDVKDAPTIRVNTMVDGKWQYNPTNISENAMVKIPKNTSEIQIVYSKDQKDWYTACTIHNPQKISAYQATFGDAPNNVSIDARWTNQEGDGECQVTGEL